MIFASNRKSKIFKQNHANFTMKHVDCLRHPRACHMNTHKQIFMKINFQTWYQSEQLRDSINGFGINPTFFSHDQDIFCKL